jgi:phage terminase large subunit-like protein
MNNLQPEQTNLPSDYSPEQQEKAELRALLLEGRRRSRNLIESIFPDTGKLRRELYPKHIEFFRASAVHRELLFMAANRVGKTIAGGYMTSVHLTGKYPHWWEGRRFRQPVNFVAASDSAKNTREIIQDVLCGQYRDVYAAVKCTGTGLIPGDDILRTTPKHGIAEAFDTVYVRHISGGVSTLVLKSYDQGVDAFMGTAKEGEWLDEEPPLEIFAEGTMRTMTTDGIIYMTFMPLNGRTHLIDNFLRTCVNRDELPIK